MLCRSTPIHSTGIKDINMTGVGRRWSLHSDTADGSVKQYKQAHWKILAVCYKSKQTPDLGSSNFIPGYLSNTSKAQKCDAQGKKP